MPKDRKPKVVKEESFSNKIRTFLGKDPLPKAKAKDIGFVGSRMKKKTRSKKNY